MQDHLEEGDAIDWLEDDELMRHWAQVSKEEEKIKVRRSAGRNIKFEGVHNVLEQMVSQAQMKKKKSKREKEKKKVVGYSTERMKEYRSKREVKDSEEVVQPRSIHQEEVDHFGKELCGKILEEVLEKYKVEDTKKGAYKNRERLEWRIFKRVHKYQSGKWCEDCWARIYAWHWEYSLQRSKNRRRQVKQKRNGLHSSEE